VEGKVNEPPLMGIDKHRNSSYLFAWGAGDSWCKSSPRYQPVRVFANAR